MKVADAVAVAGHEVHVCRYREAASDRGAHGDGGAIVLVRARRGRPAAAGQGKC